MIIREKIVIRENRGKRLFNFRSRPVDLLTLDVIVLMCLSNVKMCLI